MSSLYCFTALRTVHPKRQRIRLMGILLLSMGSLEMLTPLTQHTAQAADKTSSESSEQRLPTWVVQANQQAKTETDIPAHTTVLTASTLQQDAVESLKDLTPMLPGISFQPFGQSGIGSPVMRGLTANFNSFSSSVLLLVDDVPVMTAQGFDASLLDIDRVEVLHGPQSTLYGRNAEAGVIALYTRPLDDEAATQAQLTLGNQLKRGVQFSHRQALIPDTLFFSGTLSWQQQEGFIDQHSTNGPSSHSTHADDREHRGAHLSLRWHPQAASDITLRYRQQRYDDGAMLWGDPKTSRAQVASGQSSWNRSSGETWSLKAQQRINAQLMLHSLTAYTDYHDHVAQDTDFHPQDRMRIGRDHHLRQWSQELRLAQTGTSYDAILGLYADGQHNDLHSVSKMPLGQQDIRAEQTGQTYALFSHASLLLSPDWQITAGIRAEHYQVRLNPDDTSRRSHQAHHFSPQLGLQYHFSDHQQWHLNIARGVRSGGFNVLAPGSDYAAYAAEKNWSYEMGFKGSAGLFDSQYAVTAYWMKIQDMQVMQMPRPGMMTLTNAATASSYGVDANLSWPLSEHWQLISGIAWNHTRFDTFDDQGQDYSGHRAPFAPDVKGHLTLRHDNKTTGWFGQMRLSGSSAIDLDAANQYQRAGYGQLDLSVGKYWGNGHRWMLYTHNLTNQQYDAVGYQNGYVTVYSPPREIGLQVSLSL